MATKLDPVHQAIEDVRAQLDADPDVPYVTAGHVEHRAIPLLAKREKISTEEASRRVVTALYG
jgi:hypothetical protein